MSFDAGVLRRFAAFPALRVLAVVSLALVVYLAGSDRPLRDAEAKYAEVPREMVERNDWLTPHLNYARYFVKPPLTYWVTAGLYEVFGVSERAARLATVLWAVATALALAALAREMFGPGHGMLVVAMFFVTLGVFMYCQDAGIEFGLITFQVLAVAAFWRHRRTGSPAAACGFALAMGLGFMAKALPGVAIPAGVAVLFAALRGEIGPLRRLAYPLPATVLLGTVLPWPAIMAVRHPEFVETFFVNEHLRRFLGNMPSNDALMPTGAWLASVAGEFFPWVLYLPLLAVGTWRLVRRREVPADAVLLLAIWAVLPLVFYGASRSKVDFYGLQAYPPAILLLAVLMRRLLDGRSAVSAAAWAAPWVLVALVAAGLAGAEWASHVPGGGLGLLAVAMLALGTAGALATARPRLAAAAGAALMTLIAAGLSADAAARLPSHSVKFAADYLRREAGADAVVLAEEGAEFEHVAGLPYYLRRPVLVLKAEEGSLMHFVEADRQNQCVDALEIVTLVRRRPVYVLGRTESVASRLSRLGLQAECAASSGDRTLCRVVDAADSVPLRRVDGVPDAVRPSGDADRGAWPDPGAAPRRFCGQHRQAPPARRSAVA